MTAVEFIEPLSREDGVSRATKLFVDMYATAPEGVWAAPGRVNLIGEHTDYNGGHVFPCALTIGTYMAARKRDDRKLRFYSMNFEKLGVVESSLDEFLMGKKATGPHIRRE